MKKQNFLRVCIFLISPIVLKLKAIENFFFNFFLDFFENFWFFEKNHHFHLFFLRKLQNDLPDGILKLWWGFGYQNASIWIKECIFQIFITVHGHSHALGTLQHIGLLCAQVWTIVIKVWTIVANVWMIITNVWTIVIKVWMIMGREGWGARTAHGSARKRPKSKSLKSSSKNNTF